jgi:hypothetical protein
VLVVLFVVLQLLGIIHVQGSSGGDGP